MVLNAVVTPYGLSFWCAVPYAIDLTLTLDSVSVCLIMLVAACLWSLPGVGMARNRLTVHRPLILMVDEKCCISVLSRWHCLVICVGLVLVWTSVRTRETGSAVESDVSGVDWDLLWTRPVLRTVCLSALLILMKKCLLFDVNMR